MYKLKRRFYLTAARWFWLFASRSLKRWNPRVIIITGSVGKTTMLNLLATQNLPAHFSHNANSAFGIAFDILGLEAVRGSRLRWIYLFFASIVRSFSFTRRVKFYIVEVDAERPREAELIAQKLNPEVVLTTPVGLSHASFFDPLVAQGKHKTALAAIQAEFAKISTYARSLALFAEPPQPAPRGLSQPTGENETAATRNDGLAERRAEWSCCGGEAVHYRVEYNKTLFKTKSGTFNFAEPMPEEVGQQLLLLEYLMQYLDLPVVYDLKNFQLPPGRNNFLEGIKGTKLIDSSYNAHLISMQSVLSMTKQIRWNHKWLVISDMIQQGRAEQSEHQKLAQLILDVKAENVILIGRRTAQSTLPLLQAAGQKVESFTDVKQALPYLEQNLTGSELVVFKGSQYLEWLVEKLLKNPSDIKRLARREKAAIVRRKKRGLS
ncbi:hypothetical protein FWG86_01125 [Candidatus Saccharibacteria bacterium]|nr:hypothetical protein [Candidatus Saccharibacteria bacterium]